MRTIIGALVLGALVTNTAFGGEPDARLTRLEPSRDRSSSEVRSAAREPSSRDRSGDTPVPDGPVERARLATDLAALVPSTGEARAGARLARLAQLDDRPAFHTAPHDRRRVDREAATRAQPGALEASRFELELAAFLDGNDDPATDPRNALFRETEDASGESAVLHRGLDLATVALPFVWTGVVVDTSGPGSAFAPEAKTVSSEDVRSIRPSEEYGSRFDLSPLAGLRLGEHFRSVHEIPDFDTRRVEWGVRAGFPLARDPKTLGAWHVDVRLHARVAGDSSAELHSAAAREWITTVGITSGR